VSDPGELAGMTRLAPGVYDDGHGGMHLDADEFLEAGGYEANDETREQLVRVARRLAGEHGLDYVDEP
jgi:hypothetical protein